MINSGQWLIFLSFFWLGNMAGLLYYFTHYQICRKKISAFLNIAEDIMFCIFLLPLLWGGLLIFNYGKVEFYCLAATFLGGFLANSIFRGALDKVKQMIYNFFIINCRFRLNKYFKLLLKKGNQKDEKNGRS